MDECVDPSAPICYGILMPGAHVPSGVPVVKVRDYQRGRLDNKQLLRTDPAIERKYARSRLAGGDILLAIRGTTGVLAKVPSSLEGANITQDTARIRVRPSISREYIFQALQSPDVQRQIQLHTIGQAVQGINITEVRRLRFPLPSRPEQHAIAEILRKWDEGIQGITNLINAKRRLKRGLMQQLLTGKRRFKEFVVDPGERQTDFGVIPKDWNYVRIGQIAHELKARANGEQAPVLSCTKHSGLVESLKYFGRQVFSRDVSEYKVVRRGQFAYATNHIEEGSIGLLTHLDAGLVSPMYTVFETAEEVHSPFLLYLFKTELYRHIFEVNTNASVNRRGSLRWNQFARIRVGLPSIDEQKRIAQVISTVDDEIRLLRGELELLKEQKHGLMQKLLSGPEA